MTATDPSIQHRPGPMEKWLMDNFFMPPKRGIANPSILDYAREQDVIRAELLVALKDCQAVLQDIGYEAPRRDDPEAQVRAIEQATGVDIIDICSAADRATAALAKAGAR